MTLSFCLSKGKDLRRKVEVKILRKDGRDYRLRSRKGYFARYKAIPGKRK